MGLDVAVPRLNVDFAIILIWIVVSAEPVCASSTSPVNLA